MRAKVNIEKLKTEGAAVGKFAIIGIIATLTHAVVASTLFETGILSVVLANVCGFLTAFAVSFSGHYFWSFSHLRQSGTALRSMTRFLVVSVAGFALNSTILTLWLTFTSWPELYGLWLAILIVPAFSFIGARLWAFAHHSATF